VAIWNLFNQQRWRGLLGAEFSRIFRGNQRNETDSVPKRENFLVYFASIRPRSLRFISPLGSGTQELDHRGSKMFKNFLNFSGQQLSPSGKSLPRLGSIFLNQEKTERWIPQLDRHACVA
jgi:hypothetical protein